MPDAGISRTDGVHSRSDEGTADAPMVMADRGDAGDGRARWPAAAARRARTRTSPRARTGSRSRTRASRPPSRSPRARRWWSRVRNADSKTAPNVAVTVETDPGKPGAGTVAFGQRVDDARLVRPGAPGVGRRRGPQGRRLRGHQHVGARRAEGRPDQDVPLEGHRRRARRLHDQVPHLPRPQRPREAASGGRTDGSFKVRIDDKPVPARVDDDGNVVRGEAPGASK